MNQEIAEIKTDRVNPIKITDEKTGQVYELDFSRESVRFAFRNCFIMLSGKIIRM